MFEPKLGVSLVMISERLTPEVARAVVDSRIETLELRALSFEGDSYVVDRRLLRRLLRRRAVRAATVHAPFGDDFDISSSDDEARRGGMRALSVSLELAIELNVPTVVVHASAEPIGPDERPARLKRAQRALTELQPRCREGHRRMAVELLPRTCLGNTVEELFQILDPLDPAVFGVCLDTNHLMDRHAALADTVRRLGDRLIALHLSDYDGVDEQHLLPGEGVLDWKSFMAALRDIDYAGPFNYECGLDEGETVEERIRYLEKNFDWLSSL
ncbi:MAG: sugar phosphate isomerase/epimerase [Verrucomicrobia bacterium]|nr:sugar phosphate isomerase/epimerase [Verrucomicrobiota bacterium]